MQFFAKFGKIICWRPPWRVGAPSYGESLIRPWLCTEQQGLSRFSLDAITLAQLILKCVFHYVRISENEEFHFCASFHCDAWNIIIKTCPCVIYKIWCYAKWDPCKSQIKTKHCKTQKLKKKEKKNSKLQFRWRAPLVAIFNQLLHCQSFWMAAITKNGKTGHHGSTIQYSRPRHWNQTPLCLGQSSTWIYTLY